jgi:hypothetical protein
MWVSKGLIRPPSRSCSNAMPDAHIRSKKAENDSFDREKQVGVGTWYRQLGALVIASPFLVRHYRVKTFAIEIGRCDPMTSFLKCSGDCAKQCISVAIRQRMTVSDLHMHRTASHTFPLTPNGPKRPKCQQLPGTIIIFSEAMRAILLGIREPVAILLRADPLSPSERLTSRAVLLNCANQSRTEWSALWETYRTPKGVSGGM